MENVASVDNSNDTNMTRAVVTRLTPEDDSELELIDFLTMLREIENK